MVPTQIFESETGIRGNPFEVVMQLNQPQLRPLLEQSMRDQEDQEEEGNSRRYCEHQRGSFVGEVHVVGG